MLSRMPALAVTVVLASSPATPSDVPSSGSDVDDAGQRIASYAVELQVEDDGTLRVNESILYDYGPTEALGPTRTIRLRVPFDWFVDRVVTLSDIEVSSESAPAEFETTESRSALRIRVGDPERPVTGLHRYDISYAVRGAIQDYGSHVELLWDAIGTDWEVPIARPTVDLVQVPVQSAACYYGSSGSRLPCETVEFGSAGARFAHPGLTRDQGLTVVVALPPSFIDVPDPTLVVSSGGGSPRADRFEPSALIGAGAVGLMLGLGLGWLLWRRRRPSSMHDDAAASDPNAEVLSS